MIEFPVPDWHRSVNDYKRLASFTFENEESFGKALEAFDEKDGSLEEAPYEIIGYDTVLVPQEAIDIWSEWLNQHKILFTARRVIEGRELLADEIAVLRKRNYSPAP